MARLYASTGDGIARLDERDGTWRVASSLNGSGAQCLAVDPADPDVVYAGLREGGVRRTSDGGRSWVDCALPAPGVFSVAVSPVDGAVYAGPEPLPAMPYALVATEGRLFAGLADGQLWESNDRGDSWHACALEGDSLTRLNALAFGTPARAAGGSA